MIYLIVEAENIINKYDKNKLLHSRHIIVFIHKLFSTIELYYHFNNPNAITYDLSIFHRAYYIHAIYEHSNNLWNKGYDRVDLFIIYHHILAFFSCSILYRYAIYISLHNLLIFNDILNAMTDCYRNRSHYMVRFFSELFFCITRGIVMPYYFYKLTYRNNITIHLAHLITRIYNIPLEEYSTKYDKITNREIVFVVLTNIMAYISVYYKSLGCYNKINKFFNQVLYFDTFRNRLKFFFYKNVNQFLDL